MTGWHSVGAEAAWAEGTMREVEVADQPVVVARVGGRFWAVQGRCPHLRVRLARGTLQGKVITCVPDTAPSSISPPARTSSGSTPCRGSSKAWPGPSASPKI